MKKMLSAAGIVAISAVSVESSATHKNWTMKGSGIECSFETPSLTGDMAVSDFTSLYNNSPEGRYAVCPVSLAARWGSSGVSGYGFPASQPRWAQAMYGNVYVYHEGVGDESVWCEAVARMSDQQTYYSQWINTSQLGHQTMAVANNSTWGEGSGLELNQNLQLKSLDFECYLPPGDYISGYRVNICQKTQGCNDAQGNDHGLGQPNGHASIQTSGIACVAYNPALNIERKEDGLINQETSPHWDAMVSCPLPQVTDDSYEHYRSVTMTKVFLSGGGYTNCQEEGTCPRCWLRWQHKDLRGWFLNSAVFEWMPGGGGPNYLQQRDALVFPHGQDPVRRNGFGGTERDIGISVECELFQGFGIRGIGSTMTKTQVSGGI